MMCCSSKWISEKHGNGFTVLKVKRKAVAAHDIKTLSHRQDV